MYVYKQGLYNSHPMFRAKKMLVWYGAAKHMGLIHIHSLVNKAMKKPLCKKYMITHVEKGLKGPCHKIGLRQMKAFGPVLL